MRVKKIWINESYCYHFVFVGGSTDELHCGKTWPARLPGEQWWRTVHESHCRYEDKGLECSH